MAAVHCLVLALLVEIYSAGTTEVTPNNGTLAPNIGRPSRPDGIAPTGMAASSRPDGIPPTGRSGPSRPDGISRTNMASPRPVRISVTGRSTSPEHHFRHQDSQCHVVGRRVRVQHGEKCVGTFLVPSCEGRCMSSAEPSYSPEKGDMVIVTRCSCCRPAGSQYIRRVRKLGVLRCRQGNAVKSFLVSRMFPTPQKCACRPCSDGDPREEHPYK